MLDRFDRNVFEFERDDVAAPAEFGDRILIVVACDDLLVGDLAARRMLLRIEHDHVIAHPLCIDREHAAELAASDYADRIHLFGTTGGGCVVHLRDVGIEALGNVRGRGALRCALQTAPR